MSTTMMTAEEARNLVLAERARCLSDREWRHRIAGYGFAIRSDEGGPVLTVLGSGRDLGPLYA